MIEVRCAINRGQAESFLQPFSNILSKQVTPSLPCFMSNKPALMALDFQPWVMNFVLRSGRNSDRLSAAVSLVNNLVPFSGPDLRAGLVKRLDSR